MKRSGEIIEKKIGISPDYQYRAMRDSFWLKENWHRNKFEIVKALHRFSNANVVLDLGTGSGNFEILFARSVKKIYGVDYNDGAVSFLKTTLKKRKVKNVKLTCADMRDLPSELKKMNYDLIVSIDTLEHIKKNEGKKIINWAQRKLNRGGKVIIITPNYQSLWFLVEPVLDILPFTPKMGKHQHLSKFTVGGISKLLSKSGLRINRVVTFNLFSFLFPKKICAWLLKLEMKYLKNLGCLVAIEAVKD